VSGRGGLGRVSTYYQICWVSPTLTVLWLSLHLLTPRSILLLCPNLNLLTPPNPLGIVSYKRSKPCTPAASYTATLSRDTSAGPLHTLPASPSFPA